MTKPDQIKFLTIKLKQTKHNLFSTEKTPKYQLNQAVN